MNDENFHALKIEVTLASQGLDAAVLYVTHATNGADIGEIRLEHFSSISREGLADLAQQIAAALSRSDVRVGRVP